MRLAYSFEDRGRPRHVHRALTEEPGQRRLQHVVGQWNECWRSGRSVLHVYDEGTSLRFIDSRPCATRTCWTADGLAAEIYRLCDSAQTRASLIQRLIARPGATQTTIESAITGLVDDKVLLSLKDKVLALGVTPLSVFQAELLQISASASQQMGN